MPLFELEVSYRDFIHADDLATAQQILFDRLQSDVYTNDQHLEDIFVIDLIAEEEDIPDDTDLPAKENVIEE